MEIKKSTPTNTVTRKLVDLDKETGNIYSGSFTIAMLYTMMTVANTMVLASVLG